jgi:nuclear transport factor 2 (NTF2) superfamily protein
MNNGTAAMAKNYAGPPVREFDENGLMRIRFASINDLPIQTDERQLSSTLPATH